MEFMANLQGGIDELKPSLFELLSEQQLASLLPPSLRYLLVLATHRHPRYLIRILNNFDEVYALLSLVVERHYLRTYGGGFTENFYGLKRECVLRVRGGEVPRAQLGAAAHVRQSLHLRTADVWRNLAVMVGLPYLKCKLDEGYEIHAPQATILGAPGFGRDGLPHDATIRQRIMHYYKWFLRNVYPSINAAYYFSLLAFNLAYLFDGSKYHSPFLYLVGTRIRRLGEADYRAIASAAQVLPKSPGPRPGQSNSLFTPRILARTVSSKLLSSLRFFLPTSIFALKFLEWWHASDFARQLSRKAAEGLEIPPPAISALAWLAAAKNAATSNTRPSTSNSTSSVDGNGNGNGHSPNKSSFKPPTSAVKGPPLSASTHLPILTVPPTSSNHPAAPSSSDLCPICLNPVATATASPYGFVFCYTCIHQWVAGEHERQTAFMDGGAEEGVWADDAGDRGLDEDVGGSREGRWESGKGRCAVSGRRILGGTEGLRRVVV